MIQVDQPAAVNADRCRALRRFRNRQLVPGSINYTAMKALVCRGPAKKAPEEPLKPEIAATVDAMLKIKKTTICGDHRMIAF